MDRTLIASLGFLDPDKRESDHDLVCEYICQPDVAAKFARFIAAWSEVVSGKWGMTVQGPMNDRCPRCGYRGCSINCVSGPQIMIAERKRWSQVAWSSSSQEVIISKGEGQYKTHIGFCDCILRFEFKKLSVVKVVENYPTTVVSNEIEQEISNQPHHQSVAIEVKVIPVSIPEIIRQIKLYRQHTSGFVWVVATRWRPSEADISTLLNENIHHVFIGEKFDQWKANRNAAPAQNLLDF